LPVFYYHPHDEVPKLLAEMTGVRGFLYTNRGELEFKLQQQLIEAGYDIDPRFHTVIGTLAGSIDYHIPLNPDDELDRHTLKLCASKAPWSWIKILNGPRMMMILGYVSSAGSSPYGMGAIEMVQKGLAGSGGFIPRMQS
jgi:hypothetical protein